MELFFPEHCHVKEVVLRIYKIAVDDISSQLEALLFPSPKGLDSLEEQVVAVDRCPNPHVPLLQAVNHYTKTTLYFRPRCKLWSCPQCAETNKSLWTWRAEHGARTLYNEQQALSFITVTSHEALSPDGTLAVLPSAWNKLRCRMNRAAPGTQYFLVPEPHKDGRLHLHAIVSCDLPKRWWKDNARSCGFGYQNDVQEVVSIGGVVGYVSKYMSKMLQFTNFGKGFRRVRKTQKWPALPQLAQNDDWKIKPLPADMALNDDMRFQGAWGYSATLVDYKTAWKCIGLMDELAG